MEKNCLECDRVEYCRGLCRPHYRKWLRNTPREVRTRTQRWVDEDGNRAICQYPQCTSEVLTQGMCKYHYQHFHYRSSPRGISKSRRNRKLTNLDGTRKEMICTFEGCDAKEFNPGFCAGHYYQKLAGKTLTPIKEKRPCSIPGCEREYGARYTKTGLCTSHAATCRRFGITPSDLLTMYQRYQCGNPGCGQTEKLDIDHDHNCCPESGKSCGKCVRGWLCGPCNRALGMLQEDPRRIEGLLDYLGVIR